jgi:hypothetical protein
LLSWTRYLRSTFSVSFATNVFLCEDSLTLRESYNAIIYDTSKSISPPKWARFIQNSGIVERIRMIRVEELGQLFYLATGTYRPFSGQSALFNAGSRTRRTITMMKKLYDIDSRAVKRDFNPPTLHCSKIIFYPVWLPSSPAC